MRARAWVLPGLALCVLLSRLPFTGNGPGADADGDRLVVAARSISRTAEYSVSRLPGYPVVEIGGAWLVHLGARDLNLAAAVLSAAAAALVALLLRRAAGVSPLLGALAFAAAPIVFIHSTTSMDYLWAVAAVLGAIAAAGQGRDVLAGVLAGLASGCRLTTIAALLPAAVALSPRCPRSIARFTATALVTAGLAWSPVLARYGPGFLDWSDEIVVPWSRVLYKSTVLVWGWPGVIAWAIAILLFAGSLRSAAGRRAAAERVKQPVVLAALLWALLSAALFLRLPLEAGYLIPFVPAALILGGVFLDRRVFAGLALAILVSPLLSVGDPSRNLRDGPIFQDRAARIRIEEHSRALLAWARDRGTPAMAVVGSKGLPRLKSRLADPDITLDPTRTPASNRSALRVGQIVFLPRLDRAAFETARAAGRDVVFLPEILQENLAETGLDLAAEGAAAIPLTPQAAPAP